MSADTGRAAAPQELLEASWTQRGRSVRGRELRLELAVTAAFVASVAALVAASPPGRGPQAIAAAVVAAYALATRARFPVGTGHTAPTQLFLVPLFFVAPAQLVPALVFGGFAIGTCVAALARRSPADRLVCCGGDAIHALGPALVLTALAGGDAREAGALVLLGAFAAQLVFDLGSSIVHDRLVFGSRPEVHLKVQLEIWSVDAALAPVGLVTARVAESVGWAALAPLGLVPLLGAMAAERSRRIEEAHARHLALDLERSRHIEAVQRIGDALVSNLDVDTLLETVARSAEEALEGESRLDGWGDVAVVVAERRASRKAGPAEAEHEDIHAISCVVGSLSAPLAIISVARSRPFAENERTLLANLCQQATASAENVGRHERLLVAEERLRHQAFHDALTELPNRHLFTDRVEHALRRHARAPGAVAILFIDLDGFKLANDSLGHEAGDELLVAVAQRLNASLRDGDTAARFGGDEFAVLLEEITGAEQAQVIADRVRRALSSPVEIRARELVVRASVGLALAEPELDCEALLRRADLAMYAAKRDGGDRVEMFYPDLLVTADTRTELVEDLGYAVERRELELHYQPIADLATDSVVVVEALVRWRHPRRGLLGPGQFIELAEETGIIGELGRYVMDEACRAAATWPDTTGRSPRVSVNVSPAQLRDPSFAVDVASALRRYGLPAKQLMLEVTESVAMDAMGAARATLRQLRELGVTVALDDFGTGFSSLSYLARFSVDLLKLDRTFLADVEEDASQARLVGGVIQLARSLGVPVVAEGIERPGQLTRMRELGAELAQGYFIGGPMDGAALVGHLAGTDVPSPRIALVS